MIRINALIKGSREIPLLSTKWRHKKSATQKKSLAWLCWHSDLRFPPSSTMQNIFPLFITHLVYDFFFFYSSMNRLRKGSGRVGFLWSLCPWLVDGPLLLPVSSHKLPSVHVSVLISSYKNITFNFIIKWLHLILIIFWRSYFYIRSHSEVLGVRTSTYEFWGNTI